MVVLEGGGVFSWARYLSSDVTLYRGTSLIRNTHRPRITIGP